jgi:hypothetical protein
MQSLMEPKWLFAPEVDSQDNPQINHQPGQASDCERQQVVSLLQPREISGIDGLSREDTAA